MTLGRYIKRLEAADPEQKVKIGLGNPHSWRGRYDELAFEPVEDTTIGDMLSQARSAVGATYTGYKGGKFFMDEETTINVDMHGSWTDGSALWDMLLSLLLQP